MEKRRGIQEIQLQYKKTLDQFNQSQLDEISEDSSKTDQTSEKLSENQ